MNSSSEHARFLSGWFRAFGIGVVIYLAAYAGAIWALLALPAGSTRTILVALPIAPGLFLIGNGVRWYRRSDEFIRMRTLQAVAVTAVVTAVWTLAYSYLELLGLPHLNVGFVHTIGWPVFVVQMVRLVRSTP